VSCRRINEPEGENEDKNGKQKQSKVTTNGKKKKGPKEDDRSKCSDIEQEHVVRTSKKGKK